MFLQQIQFQAWHFVLAGGICALGPILIHLLNRRRYKVVHWAAMDFLREALQRNRRMMQIRDLLLLLLRTAAVALFGAAIAQPFFAARDEKFDGSRPLHAVLVVDNSLSMAYQPSSTEGTLLDRAKEKAKKYVNDLPQDSRVSVIPLCGSKNYSPDPYTKDDALKALENIEPVDRSASVSRAMNEARKACDTGPNLAKRVVLLSDQQLGNWTDTAGAETFQNLPSVQVVDVSPSDLENTWISAFKVEDGLADVETPTTFLVEVRHHSQLGRIREVPVTLSVDGVEVASKTVTLEPGLGAREVTFQYVFNSYQPEPGKPVFVPVRASLESDALPHDDERHLVVPVVAALPVVFIDQYSDEEESPAKNRIGETRHLRKLLAPVSSRTDSPRQVVRVRHLKYDQVQRESLEDARLVVVAGLRDPKGLVPLLRDYVRQGGQLLIAAGGVEDVVRNSGFDPELWNTDGWLDGDGILPVPLRPEPIGQLPEQAGESLKPFFLSFESLGGHDYFQLADNDEKGLRDLYAEAFFFRAVAADVSPDTLTALKQAEIKRLEEELSFVSQAAKLAAEFTALEGRGELTEEQRETRRVNELRLRELRPNWLLWHELSGRDELSLSEDPDERARQLDQLASRGLPRVLARFAENNVPFLVERNLGDGTVIFCSTSLLSGWNTLPNTNAMLLFDRVLRSMIRSTLPERNFTARERIDLPVAHDDRDLLIRLQRPGEREPETLDTGFIGQEQRGVSILRPLARGLYRVSATRQGELPMAPAGGDETSAAPKPVWEILFTVNGASGESELAPLTRDKFEERTAGADATWVGIEEEISLSGMQIRGQNLWWWLALVILAMLLVELGVLARPVLQARAAAASA